MSKKRPTEGAPGDPELVQLCADAKRVSEFCNAIGVEFRGAKPLEKFLNNAIRAGVSLQELVEDPEQRPYIWDLPEESSS